MTKTYRLTDLQLVLLSNAAARDNGSIVPLPDCCAQDTTRISKAVSSLLRRKLVEEMPVTGRNLAWREEDQNPIGLFITEAGRSAIGAGDAQTAEEATANANEIAGHACSDVAAAKTALERPGSKIGAVVTLLERDEGATLNEMVEVTGWLPHTTRAALTGLRKKGHAITKTKREDNTCYRIGAEG